MSITFRNSKIIYYGPHPCHNCDALVAKMGNEWGGSAFSYPDGPIYPNTEWHPHVCDQRDVTAKRLKSPKKSGTPFVDISVKPTLPLYDGTSPYKVGIADNCS